MNMRLAAREDLPAIVDIYNSTIPSRQVTADTEPVSVESREAWFAAHRRPERPLWVVELQGRVAGWLSFSDFYGRPAYARTAEISVYVHEDFRRRGVGTFLVMQAMRAARALDVDVLLGFVFRHNDPSIKLFRAQGFSEWGCLPRVAILDGVERDLTILGRSGLASQSQAVI